MDLRILPRSLISHHKLNSHFFKNNVCNTPESSKAVYKEESSGVYIQDHTAIRSRPIKYSLKKLKKEKKFNDFMKTFKLKKTYGFVPKTLLVFLICSCDEIQKENADSLTIFSHKHIEFNLTILDENNNHYSHDRKGLAILLIILLIVSMVFSFYTLCNLYDNHPLKYEPLTFLGLLNILVSFSIMAHLFHEGMFYFDG